jgi:protein-arginine kinase activator protein McsA
MMCWECNEKVAVILTTSIGDSRQFETVGWCKECWVKMTEEIA